MTAPQQRYVKKEDIELAKLYVAGHPGFSRGELGILLEKEGLGINHHTFSGCADRVEYINFILDKAMPE